MNVSLQLPELGSGDRLAPISRAGALRTTFVEFEVELDPVPEVTQASIELRDQGGIYHSENLPVGLFAAGSCLWRWDGIVDGAFDSSRLKMLTDAVVRVGGSMDILRLQNCADEVDWVDVRIVPSAGTVDVTLRIDFQNEDGVPTSDFDRMVGLAVEGIEKYWSRTVSLGTQAFVVKTKVVRTTNHAFDMDLYRREDFHRSHNFMIIDATVFYCTNEPIERFLYDAAHEFGHSVLYAAGDFKKSVTHHGTSDFLQNLSDKATECPRQGEIDLMRYYTDSIADFYKRLTASEEDVRRLIWLAAVDFNA
jgi:hypothetical protein